MGWIIKIEAESGDGYSKEIAEQLQAEIQETLIEKGFKLRSQFIGLESRH